MLYQIMSNQEMEIIDDIRWSHPSTIMIGGPSSSGKTQLTNSILINKDQLFSPIPKKVILYYREWQQIYASWKTDGLVQEFYDILPEEEEFRERLDLQGEGSLVIFDDMFLDIEKNKNFFDNLFCVNSHHLKVTVILIVHNLFTKNLRTLSLNCHRFFLTQSLRDKGQLQALARQAFPGKSEFVVEAFDDSMAARYGHICLDFSPGCSSTLRVTSNWFAEPSAINCYLYKPGLKSSRVKMSSKAFTKLILIPQNRYLKLISNDCDCKIGVKTPLANSVHSTGSLARFQSLEPHPQIRDPAPTYGEETSRETGSVGARDGRGEKLQTEASPSSLLLNIQREKKSTTLDPSPHLPTQATSLQADDTAVLALPPPPPPPQPSSQPSSSSSQSLSLPSSSSLTLQPLHPITSVQHPKRDELHRELQQAIHNRSSRLQPYFIDRPPPLPHPNTSDIRRDLHDELQQVVARRRNVQESEDQQQQADQKSIEYTNRPEQTQAAIDYSNLGQKAIQYSNPEQKMIQYSNANPTRALENLNPETVPESNYPIALRNVDADLAPTIKKTAKIPKRKPLKKTIFAPSPPILDEVEENQNLENLEEKRNLKAREKKRKGVHLPIPKPTKPKKTQKLNQGEKRAHNFPLKPGKRLKSYPLWKI